MDEISLINNLKSSDISKQINTINKIKNIFNSQKLDEKNAFFFKDIKKIINALLQCFNNENISTIELTLDTLVDAIPVIFQKYNNVAVDITMYKIIPSLVELWKITNNTIHEKLQNCIVLCKNNVNNCKFFYSQLLKYGAINEEWKIRYKCIEYMTVLINSDNISTNENFPLQPIIRVLINRLNDISEIVVNSSEFTLNRIVNLIGEEEFLNIINLLPTNQIQLFKKHENQCLRKERSQALSAPSHEEKNIYKTIPLLNLRKKDLEITDNNSIKLLFDEKEDINSFEDSNLYDNPMNNYLSLNDKSYEDDDDEFSKIDIPKNNNKVNSDIKNCVINSLNNKLHDQIENNENNETSNNSIDKQEGDNMNSINENDSFVNQDDNNSCNNININEKDNEIINENTIKDENIVTFEDDKIINEELRNVRITNMNNDLSDNDMINNKSEQNNDINDQNEYDNNNIKNKISDEKIKENVNPNELNDVINELNNNIFKNIETNSVELNSKLISNSKVI